MTWPVLSIITWAPFVGAVLIMFTARHRPLLVRGIAVASTAVSLLGSLLIFVAYDREAAGFQFYEEIALVPPLGIKYQLGVDGIVNLFSAWTLRAGDRLRGIQSGLPQDYIYAVALGTLLLIVWSKWPR